MVCPYCNEQMNHMNKWFWTSSESVYQTYDYLKCPKCERLAVEFYYTEFVDHIDQKPVISFVNTNFD